MERTFVRKALTEQMFGVIIYPEQKKRLARCGNTIVDESMYIA